MNASDFRIESVRNAMINGRAARIFKAYRAVSSAFIFCGEFSAPARTAKRHLWMIVAGLDKIQGDRTPSPHC